MEHSVEKTLEQILMEEGELLTAAAGVSMLPCIRAQKDVLHLVKATEPPKVYDVILYRRKNKTLILHRILNILDSGYVLCGDNQSALEYGIQESQILGVLRGFYRNGSYVDCRTNRLYLAYVKVWCHSLRVRRGLLYTMNLGKRGWNKITCRKKN